MKKTTPKNQPAGTKKPATKPAAGRPPVPSKGELVVKAAETLAPEATKVRARVRLAVEDPKKYAKTHAKELARRGVTAPVPKLPFLALIDGLAAEARVALLDPKAPAAVVIAELRKLRAPSKLDFSWADSLDYETLNDLPTERVIEAVAARVEALGVVLLNLDAGSDQLAIGTVHRSRVNITLAAMKAAGHPARIVAAKPLADKPKPAAKRPRGGSALEEWPDCSADPSNTWRYFIDEAGVRSLCLRKWPQAFDVMLETLTGARGSKSEKKSFPTPRECTSAYVAYYQQLEREGWRQFSAPEHAKALKAATQKGTPQK
ncbi:MAG: hypothetical protein IPM35_13960 [Myxococcales bacterium]|nr:hypothetical protein [Myxococcales bacterium]